ncbi:MAG: hypothetical protein SPE56_07160 [Prevotella sp.]|nr:hypothetical protein [Prevotella sp.]
MKKSILSLMALAIAGLAFTSCDDVPMPYNQPNVKPGTEVTPQGTGTAADPYNVAAALKVVNALGTDETTENAIYVKGKVTGTPTIETEKFGNATYYITDDGSNKIYIFQSYYLGNRKFTADDKLNEGDEVIVCGKFTNYKGNTPETVGKGSSYIYSLNGKTEGGGDTPTPGEAKGDGTQANPYNAAGANKAASALTADGKQENVYVSGIISKIGEINTSYGNATYYISEDGTTTSEQFEIYRGYYTNGDKFTSADQLKVGQKVTVLGTLVNYMGNTPEMAPGSKIVSIDGSGNTPDTPDTPGTSEGVTISGTTVTLTNSSVTAGTETATIDLNTLGLASNDKVSGPYSLSDGSTISVAQGEGKSAPIYNSATKGFRIYASNTITFNASKPIAKIVFSCDSYKGTDYVGNASQTITFSGNTATYCNYIEGNSGGTQLRVKTITVTYAK